MSLENRINHYKEVQAEDFDILESAVEHAEKLGLKLRDFRLDRDGRIVDASFLAFSEFTFDDRDKEDIPKKPALELHPMNACTVGDFKGATKVG